MNRAFDRSFGTILAINGYFLMSGFCGGLAWFAWPRTPEWWGLGVFSVFLAFAAMIAFLKAVRAIVALHGRERAIAEFESRGKAPAPSATRSRPATRCPSPGLMPRRRRIWPERLGSRTPQPRR